MSGHYVWLIWSSAFLVPWTLLFLGFPRFRKAMWRASLLTAPFGLTVVRHVLERCVRAPHLGTFGCGVGASGEDRSDAMNHSHHGSHGKGFVNRLLLGSMTQRLADDLPTPVLVVPGVAPVRRAEKVAAWVSEPVGA